MAFHPKLPSTRAVLTPPPLWRSRRATGQAIEIRQIEYLNNLVEQDHRAIKRIVRLMLGFNTFDSARCTLRGIELMHMIKKGQMIADVGKKLSTAGQFYLLVAQNPLRVAEPRSKDINATELAEFLSVAKKRKTALSSRM
jgi:hypothetical protein